MLRIKQVLTVDMVLIEITEKHKLSKVCNKKKSKELEALRIAEEDIDELIE